jgi:peptidoglycan/xylan/chitin deacetylase (PgdA/CDA1 family)
MARRGYRERVVRLLKSTGGLDVLLRLQARRPSPWLTVLTYHRVAEPDKERRVDVGVIDATPAQFEDQVAYLAEHYTIIGVDELLHYTRTGKLPPNSVLITFDDGYRDVLTTAVPILRRYGAKAIFFIATQYPDSGRLFWWDRIAYLVRRSPLDRLVLDYPRALTLELEPDREEAVKRVTAVAKREADIDLDLFVEALAAASQAPWNEEIERELASDLIMTWDEVRQLVELGMDVESHTRTHRILAHLGTEDAAWELYGSREDLRHQLGYAPRAVAYPVGAPLVHRPDILDSMRKAGYALGYTNCTGSNDLRRSFHPLDVNRIGMDVALSAELFRGMLALPALGHASRRRARRAAIGH